MSFQRKVNYLDEIHIKKFNIYQKTLHLKLLILYKMLYYLINLQSFGGLIPQKIKFKLSRFRHIHLL